MYACIEVEKRLYNKYNSNNKLSKNNCYSLFKKWREKNYGVPIQC